MGGGVPISQVVRLPFDTGPSINSGSGVMGQQRTSACSPARCFMRATRQGWNEDAGSCYHLVIADLMRPLGEGETTDGMHDPAGA
jgi:hypothetical protein